jgi:hypothetical protein
MSLIALQREFRASLLAERGDTVSPGLAVYHHAYRAQLVDCLRETFPQLRKWLGDEEFTEAGLAHIERVPPHSWTLGAYGKRLDQTVAALYPDDAEVAELAWLEWSLSCAFAGPDAPAVPAETLSDTDWDKARLVFVPTFALGTVRTNIGSIWSALAADKKPPPVETLPEPAPLIIWRHDFSPSFRTIDDEELDAIAQMRGGATFGDLCNTTVARLGADEGVEQAGLFLGQWLRDGLIAGINARDQVRGASLNTRATIPGSRASMESSTRAGPSGWRRPCSQFRRVGNARQTDVI